MSLPRVTDIWRQRARIAGTAREQFPVRARKPMEQMRAQAVAVGRGLDAGCPEELADRGGRLSQRFRKIFGPV
jgi:hypothetical protein